MRKSELRKRTEFGTIANGIVEVRGDFYTAHREEIKHLIEHSVQNIQGSHPFERIVARQENGDRVILEVTSAKLAQHLGRALNSAYGGETVYEMLHDTGQARVYWHRDGWAESLKRTQEEFKRGGKKMIRRKLLKH